MIPIIKAILVIVAGIGAAMLEGCGGQKKEELKIPEIEPITTPTPAPGPAPTPAVGPPITIDAPLKCTGTAGTTYLVPQDGGNIIQGGEGVSADLTEFVPFDKCMYNTIDQTCAPDFAKMVWTNVDVSVDNGQHGTIGMGSTMVCSNYLNGVISIARDGQLPGQGDGETDYGIEYQLDNDEMLFVSVIAAESIGQGKIAWEVVANVIMNRVGQREWANYTSPRAVMEKEGAFSCLSNGGSSEYNKAVSYLNNRVDDNNIYEQIISVVLPIYHGETADTTGGAQLYYSPDSMTPKGSVPWWASSYKQINVPGINPNEFVLFTGERID